MVGRRVGYNGLGCGIASLLLFITSGVVVSVCVSFLELIMTVSLVDYSTSYGAFILNRNFDCAIISSFSF